MNCRTECGHKFHWMCLREWINKNADCPLCKSKKFNDVKVYCLKCRCREASIELKFRMNSKLGSGNQMSCDECEKNKLYVENSWVDLGVQHNEGDK